MNRVRVIFENNKYFLEIRNDELPGVITRLELSKDELTSLLGKITKYIN
jgi:hypothetical protein